MNNDTRAQSAHPFWQLPLGIQLAAAALVVAVPRYVIAFLAADNLRFPTPVEGLLLGVSAFATAIIVAGGGAYVAHAVASAQANWLKRGLLLGLWLVLLACEIVLLAPPVVASLRKSELAHVLVAQFYFDALWSVVMVATPALCAAACVLAASLDKRSETQSETLKTYNPTFTPEPVQSEPLPVAHAPVQFIEVAPVMLPCPDCKEPFSTKQALSAHKRFCKMRQATQPLAVSTNGNGAH